MLDLKHKQVFVTGGAGFIGSNLVDVLLKNDCQVVGYDNLSTGMGDFLAEALRKENFQFIQGDILDFNLLKSSMRGSDFVFHLAANADVRFGPAHPKKDLEQNTIATHNILEAMRENNIKHLAFTSTGSVYGEAKVIPTPENCPLPIQTSLYGASKMAGEGLATAYSYAFGLQVYIFRFVSILGERYTHGHVFDFYRQLKEDSSKLKILGDGTQKKSYLYIGDCLEAMLLAIAKGKDKINIFNLGTDEYINVKESVDIITSFLSCKPKLNFSGGDRGWIGDNPFIFLDCQNIRKLGWHPKLSIKEALHKTMTWLSQNEWVFTRRK